MRTQGITSNERGIALIAVMLALLVAFSLAGSFMAVSVGERSLTSNVHVARNSLFAADAGVRIMQQRLANMAQSKLDSLLDIATPGQPVISNPTTLFPSGDVLDNSSAPRFHSVAQITFTDSVITDTAQVYNYSYSITSSGGFGTFGERKVQSQGILRVSASHGYFTDFLLFTNVHTMPDGTPVWFSSSSTFDGRVHTNGEFRFMYGPSFFDEATSVNQKAWYWNSGSPRELAANYNGTIDVPNFYGGFQRNVASIPLPANSYIQFNAALGIAGTTMPSNVTINSTLGIPGTGGAPNGIYFAHSGGAINGGLFVQGSLDHCTLVGDTLGPQTVTLRQNSSSTTFLINPSANTTRVMTATDTTTYTGVPNGMLYVNGGIGDVSGPPRIAGLPPGALSPGQQWMIAASGDIVLQNDLTYTDYATGGSVLGIYSSGGSVRIGSSAPNDMYLDAFVMATGGTGAFQVDNWTAGSSRGTFHLRGGVVTRYFGAFNTMNSNGVVLTGFGRDFHYDRRGLVPPFYPVAPNTYTADSPVARTLVWKEM